MKVLWLLPNETIHENIIDSFSELLLVLNLVNMVSINGLTYQYINSELVIENDIFSLAVSLR